MNSNKRDNPKYSLGPVRKQTMVDAEFFAVFNEMFSAVMRMSNKNTAVTISSDLLERAKALNRRYAIGGINIVRSEPLPTPAPVAEQGGWHYDYDFLKSLTEMVNEKEFGEGIGMEEVEAVLLTIEYRNQPNPFPPKEADGKAKELVEKFMYELMFITNIADRLPIAKQCALICVDEMMLSYEAEDGDHATQYYYWQQVRTAINQL